jgi:hypothetical protein
MLDIVLNTGVSKLKDTAEYINRHPEEFIGLLKTVFGTGGGMVKAKQRVLDLVDLVMDRLALAAVELAVADPDPCVRVRGLQAVYRGQYDVLAGKVRSILEDRAEPFETRKWAIHILGTTDPEGVGRLLRALAHDRSESCDLRNEAIFALTNAPSSRTLGALCTLLGDEAVEIRRSGAWALGRIGAKESIDCLLGALEDKDEEVQSWAVRALRDMDEAKALQGLADALSDASPEEQERMIRLVVDKRSDIILREIVELLESECVNVRRQAAWALGVSPYPPAMSSLERLLEDDDSAVRDYAKCALLRLGRIDASDFGLML